MTGDTDTPALPRRTLLTYAVGSVGTGGFATLPGLVLVYYLTDAVAVPAAAAGLILTVSKVWDVIVAPLVGAASDRQLAGTGSRRRFMTIGALTLPLFFVLTFAVPAAANPLTAAIWTFVSFLLATTAFALFQVPYIALPAELSDSYDGRTRLLAWRVAVLAVAILAFGAGGPILRGDGDSLTGYLVMAIIAGAVIGIGMLISSRSAQQHTPTAASAVAREPLGVVWRRAWGESIAVLRGSRPFRMLLTAFVLQALATGMMLAGASYVAHYLLGSQDATTFLFASLIAPALIFMPIWTKLSARFGKELSFLAATALFAVATASMIPLLWAPGAWVYGPTALAGVAYAGMQALPMAMLSDVIALDTRTSGGRGGSFSGAWTAGETAGLALGGGLWAGVLAVAGYVSSSAADFVDQSPRVHDAIALGFSAVPAVLTVVSAIALLQYGLRREDIDVPDLESAT